MAKKSQFIVTRVQLANLIHCTPDQISKRIQEGMPGVIETGGGRGHHTKIDLERALPWLIDRQAKGLDEERERYYRLQGDKLDLDIRTRLGELIEQEAVKALYGAMAISIREGLLSLPTKAVQRGYATDEDGLIALVDEILSELANPPKKRETRKKARKKTRRKSTRKKSTTRK